MGYVSVPDNSSQFYAFVNAVINNRNGEAQYSEDRPSHIGPHNVSYTRNEIGESFMIVDNKKAESFINMIIDQFTCLRTYWDALKELDEWTSADKYTPKY